MYKEFTNNEFRKQNNGKKNIDLSKHFKYLIYRIYILKLLDTY
jgi:hypothetical protein